MIAPQPTIRQTKQGRSAQRQVTLSGQTGAIYCVAWSPDGDRIASTSGEGTVWIWDVSTGRALERIRLHSRACHRVQWDPFHDSRLASVGADKRYVCRRGLRNPGPPRYRAVICLLVFWWKVNRHVGRWCSSFW